MAPDTIAAFATAVLALASSIVGHIRAKNGREELREEIKADAIKASAEIIADALIAKAEILAAAKKAASELKEQ